MHIFRKSAAVSKRRAPAVYLLKMLSLVREEMRKFNLKDSAFSVSTANWEPLVLTLPVKAALRVFQFADKPCAYTTGTGNTYPHGSKLCTPEEVFMFFFRIRALLEEDKEAFIKGVGAKCAGELWDEVHRK